MEPEQDALSAEELEKQSEANFEAGRKVARGEEPDEKEDVQKAEVPEAVKAEGDPPPAEEAEGKPPVFIAGLTEDELKQTLAKAQKYDALAAQLTQETSKIYGKFGEIQGELKKLAAGKKIGKDSLKRFAENYPDLAEDLAADLEGLTAGPDNTQAFEERLAQVRNEMSQGFQKALAERDVRMVAVAKPDWQKTIAQPEWDLWLGTLPAERRQEVETSSDPVVAIRALNDHEVWLGRSKDSKKQDRLQKAITPTGDAPEPQEKTIKAGAAAFEAGRKAARARLGLAR